MFSINQKFILHTRTRDKAFIFAGRMTSVTARHHVVVVDVARLALSTRRVFGGSHVIELKEDHRSDTYRAVYTVRFKEAVYVLHVFKKKST